MVHVCIFAHAHNTTPSTCSNNGSEQLCDCRPALSGNRTPRGVIRVTVSSVCVHRNYNGPFGRTTLNEHLWHKIRWTYKSNSYDRKCCGCCQKTEPKIVFPVQCCGNSSCIQKSLHSRLVKSTWQNMKLSFLFSCSKDNKQTAACEFN